MKNNLAALRKSSRLITNFIDFDVLCGEERFRDVETDRKGKDSGESSKTKIASLFKMG
jgi:hypothetical protein